MSRLARVRASLEPLRASDETEVEKRAFGVFSPACLGPRVLFGARTGSVDAKPDACPSGEIDRGDLSCSTDVEPYGDVEPYSRCHRSTNEEPICNQRGHATRAYCKQLALRKQA